MVLSLRDVLLMRRSNLTSFLDPTWHDELDEGLGRSGARAGHNPQLQRGTQGYDEIIYTEKVTKELDSQGHVLATNVERGGPRASEFVGNGMSTLECNAAVI